MARFHGTIGFATYVEDPPGSGVMAEKITERSYTGDIQRNTFKWEEGEHLTDEVNVSNRISVVADSYANSHFSWMRYVTWMGEKWKITSIEVQFPRLLISIGGVYND